MSARESQKNGDSEFHDELRLQALTPELRRPARGEPGGAEAAKRARLERIVSHYAHGFTAGGEAIMDDRTNE